MIVAKEKPQKEAAVKKQAVKEASVKKQLPKEASIEPTQPDLVEPLKSTQIKVLFTSLDNSQSLADVVRRLNGIVVDDWHEWYGYILDV